MAEKDEANANPPQRLTGEGLGEKSTSASSGATLRPNLVALTIDVDASRMVKIEKVDSTGGRRDLSDEDAASLTKGNTIPTLEALIEQAFEAGIACVVGDEGEEDETQESDDEAALRRLLLIPLMERTAVHGLLQPEVLGRAILASAIEQAIRHRRGETKASSRQAGGSTAKPRPPSGPGSAHER
jgi:hypothetical protein